MSHQFFQSLLSPSTSFSIPASFSPSPLSLSLLYFFRSLFYNLPHDFPLSILSFSNCSTHIFFFTFSFSFTTTSPLLTSSSVSFPYPLISHFSFSSQLYPIFPSSPLPLIVLFPAFLLYRLRTLTHVQTDATNSMPFSLSSACEVREAEQLN